MIRSFDHDTEDSSDTLRCRLKQYWNAYKFIRRHKQYLIVVVDRKGFDDFHLHALYTRLLPQGAAAILREAANALEGTESAIASARSILKA